MPIRQQVLSVILAMVVGGPGCALAQGRGHRMGGGDSQGRPSSALQALEPQMQQMSGLMQQMADRIKAGPLTSDQALHLSGMLELLATIMSKMAAGIPGADTGTLLADMKVRLAAMQVHSTLPAQLSASPGMGASPPQP